MAKKPFRVTKTKNRLEYRYDTSLRNFLLHWQMNRTKRGIITDLPDGDWIVRFSWEHSLIVPGLLFREA